MTSNAAASTYAATGKSVSGGCVGLPDHPRRPLNVRPRIVSVGRTEDFRRLCAPPAVPAPRHVYRQLMLTLVSHEPGSKSRNSAVRSYDARRMEQGHELDAVGVLAEPSRRSLYDHVV